MNSAWIQSEALNLAFTLIGFFLGAVVLVVGIFEIRYLLRRDTPRQEWFFTLVSMASLAVMSVLMTTHMWFGLGLYSLLILPLVLVTSMVQIHYRIADVRNLHGEVRRSRRELRNEMLEIVREGFEENGEFESAPEEE
jgi:hypothetical protein